MLRRSMISTGFDPAPIADAMDKADWKRAQESPYPEWRRWHTARWNRLCNFTETQKVKGITWAGAVISPEVTGDV